MFYIIAVILLFLPIKLLFPTKIIGKKNLPKRGQRCVVTSNHYSNFDGLIYEANLMHHFRFMSKKEIFKCKLFGWILKDVGLFPVDRQNFGPTDFKYTLKLLKGNKQVFIFPEGTRNKSGSEEMLKIRTGIITFASKSDAEIVPMVMLKKPKIFSKNYVLVGEPFKVTGDVPNKLTKEEMVINLQNYTKIMENLRKNLDEIVMAKHKKKKNA